MINFRTPIIGIDDTVSNPVRVSVLKELQRTLSIKDSARVIATQEIDELVRKEWNLKQEVKDSEFQEDIVRISSEEEPAKETYFKTPSTNHYPKIFKDKDVVLRPVYVNTKLSIRIEIQSKSKSYIAGVKEKLRLLLLSASAVSLHNVLFRYHIPPNAALILSASYKYNKNYGLADNFEEYLFTHSDNRLTKSTTQGGTNHIVSVLCKEEQNGVQGKFVFDLNAKVEVKDLYYTFNFQYDVDFLKPVYMDVFYDTVIANQQLPDALILSRGSNGKAPTREIEDIFTEFRNDEWFLSNMFSVYNGGYLRLPQTDNHPAIIRPKSEIILMSALINLTPDDKRGLFNLGELPDVSLSDEVLMFLQLDHEYITKPEESLFNLYIYSGSTYRHDIPLKVDSELNIYSDIELDLRETYRVYLVLNTTQTLLSDDARSRMKEHLKKIGIEKQISLSLSNEEYIQYLKSLNSSAYESNDPDAPESNDPYQLRKYNRSIKEDIFLNLVGDKGLSLAIKTIGDKGATEVISSGLATRNEGLRFMVDSPFNAGVGTGNPVYMKTVQTSFIIAHMKES